MRYKAGFVVVAIVVAATACGSSSKSSTAHPETPGTVGRRVSASEASRSAALVEKALVDAGKGNTKLAKREFEAAVEHNANNKFGWYNLGVIASSAKDLKTAGTDYKNAITIDPHFQSALYNYGILLVADDLDQAIDYLAAAVRENDKDANAHWHLGLALAQRNNGTDSARSTVELNKALKLNPRMVAGGATPPSTAAP